MSTYDNNMPTTYTTQPTYNNPNTGTINKDWLTSIPAILKYVESVLCLITFICATVSEDFVKHWGGGWVQFVSMTALLTTLIIIIFEVFYIRGKLPHSIPWNICEMVYLLVVVVFYFISGIVAAVKASRDDAIGAATFFSFACMCAYGVDLFLKFMEWRGSNSQSEGTAQHTTGTVETSDITPGVYPANMSAENVEAGKAVY